MVGNEEHSMRSWKEVEKRWLELDVGQRMTMNRSITMGGGEGVLRAPSQSLGQQPEVTNEEEQELQIT
jgi:hypothetical protein